MDALKVKITKELEYPSINQNSFEQVSTILVIVNLPKKR